LSPLLRQLPPLCGYPPPSSPAGTPVFLVARLPFAQSLVRYLPPAGTLLIGRYRSCWICPTDLSGWIYSSMARVDRFSVRWVTSTDKLFWVLWSRRFSAPLEGRWWYSVLDRSEMDAQFTFAYGVLQSSVEPVGIASDAVGYFRRYERAIDWAS